MKEKNHKRCRTRHNARKALFCTVIILTVLLAILRIINKSLFEIITVGCLSEIIFLWDSATGAPLKCIMMNNEEDATNYYISMVDNEVVQEFYHNGGDIATDDITLRYYMGGTSHGGRQTLGTYLPSENKIAVSSCTKAIADATVVHEMGHYYDHLNNLASASPRFKEIAEKEIARHASRSIDLKQDYSYADYLTNGDFSEYFATTFQEYIIRPHYLKYVAPDTYNYFDTVYGGNEEHE